MLVLVIVAALVSASVAERVVTPSSYGCAWRQNERADADETVSITIVLKKSNMDKLEKIALDISNPQSPNFGKFLSAKEVNDLTAPAEQDLARVTNWLTANKVSFTTQAAVGVITVNDKVSTIESLLQTQFYKTVNRMHAQSLSRAKEYVIPSEVEDSIHAIFGMHGLPLPPRASVRRQATNVDAVPLIGPSDLLKAYGVSGVKPTGSLGNRQAVAEFQGQLMSSQDLEIFFQKYVPSAPASDALVYKYHGGNVSGQGIEAELDVQYIMGVAPGIKTEFYEQMNQDFCSDLQAWTTLLLSTDDIPLIHSISYGWQGNLTQIGCLDSEVTAVDADFAKLAARGIAIVFASGDSGSGYAPPSPPMPPPCNPTKPGQADTVYQGTTLRSFQIPNQEGAYECCSIAHEIGITQKFAGWTFVPGPSTAEVRRSGAPPNPANVGVCTIFATIAKNKTQAGSTSGPYVAPPPSPPGSAAPLWPSWPASSPWVTSVGATRFHNDVIGTVEDAVNQEDYFGSGGGFSFQFPQATWQAAAVTHYFNTVPASTLPPPSACTYPKNGRATPDVSALGTGFNVISDGEPLPGGVGGTSASAPTFSAIMSLVNEARFQAGKKQLGYLNQFIYQNANAFNDITAGSDKIGRGGPLLPYGFNCTAGWDPITGVGTPNFPLILKAAMALP